MNDSKERGKGEVEGREDKTSTAGAASLLPQTQIILKELEDMLHNKIKQKKEELHKTTNIAETDRLSIEIDTHHWVLSQCLSIRRLLKGQESELRYDTITSERR